MVPNSKKRALFFSAGEYEMNMNAYEEYKTIIMAKFNTTTAVRARCVGMFIGGYLCMNIRRQVSTGTEVSSTGLKLHGCWFKSPHLLPRCSFTFPWKSL